LITVLLFLSLQRL